MSGFRLESDTLGQVQVPADALYGAQTQRAVDNFPISGLRLPRAMIRALGLIKATAAEVNAELGLLEGELAAAIAEAARAVAQGEHDDQFPVDIFQTGSGTSSNLNANEVVATLAQRALGRPVHPLDHVNRGQSSNDVIPTAIHVAAYQVLDEQLLPALDRLRAALLAQASRHAEVVKTGRTHLMDAAPLTLGQEISGWAHQVGQGSERLRSALPRLAQLAQGGTAVGTGVGSHPEFGVRFARRLGETTGLPFVRAANAFAAQAAQDTAVEVSGQARTLAVSLLKIANDLRWMASGPLAGLGEISLPALQPGSSIMPGKVNPVIPEAVAMVCVQVIGNDAAMTVAGQSGNFQLNAMLPLIAHNLLQSLELLARAARLLADKAVAPLDANDARLQALVERSPLLATALGPLIGYDDATRVARQAAAEQRTVLEVARERTQLPPADLARILDPRRQTDF